jgi:hypothetical protein
MRSVIIVPLNSELGLYPKGLINIQLQNMRDTVQLQEVDKLSADTEQRGGKEENYLCPFIFSVDAR